MLQKKQLLLLSMGIGFIIFIIIVLILTTNGTSHQNSPITQIEPTIDATQQNTIYTSHKFDEHPSSPTSVLSEKSNQEYRARGYIIRFPSDWTTSVNTTQDVEILSLTRQSPFLDPVAPSLTIDAIANSKITVAQKVNSLSKIAKKSKIVISTTPYTSLIIDTPSTFNGQSYGLPMEMENVYLEKNGIQYEFLVNYQKGNSTDKSELNTILQSIRFL